MFTRKRIVIALGGNALGNTLPEQMVAVKTTAKALCDLIEEGHQVVVVHGNGPQVGMINNAMSALSREDENQPNTPLSVCVAMSQAYIGYDLQNALREELRIRGFVRTPVVTVVTQVRVDPNDPAFENPCCAPTGCCLPSCPTVWRGVCPPANGSECPVRRSSAA